MAAKPRTEDLPRARASVRAAMEAEFKTRLEATEERHTRNLAIAKAEEMAEQVAALSRATDEI